MGMNVLLRVLAQSVRQRHFLTFVVYLDRPCHVPEHRINILSLCERDTGDLYVGTPRMLRSWRRRSRNWSSSFPFSFFNTSFHVTALIGIVLFSI